MIKQIIYLSFAILIGVAGNVSAGTYSGGDGSAENPYKIATPNDLNDIGNNPEDWDKNFILTNDINIADYTYSKALISQDTSINLGYQGTAFTGTFDGNDYSIIALTIDTNDANFDYLGIFGVIESGGLVSNLSIEDAHVIIGDTSKYVGTLAGECIDCNIIDCNAEGTIVGGIETYAIAMLVGDSSGYIENSSVSGSVLGGEQSRSVGGLAGVGESFVNCISNCIVEGGEYVGGLVGTSYGNIENCHSAGSVSGNQGVGGLIGDLSEVDLILNNCSSTSTVSCTLNWAGGLVGINLGTITNSHATGNVQAGTVCSGGLVGGNQGPIINCYATGNVQAGTELAGGLVGNSIGFISNCFATGNVYGFMVCDMAGGLVGGNKSQISNCYATGSASALTDAGGLVGANVEGDAIISNCYSTGSASAPTFVGGLLGRLEEDATVTDCFWDIQTSGLTTSAAGTGKTTDQLQLKSTFTDAGWDFVTPVWQICPAGIVYPHLVWEDALDCQRYSGGLGTSDDPFKIATPNDINNLAQNPTHWDTSFILVNDINLAEYYYNTALIAPDTNNTYSGFQGTAFTGIFDGNNHIISNLTIDDGGAGNWYLGLFGQVGDGAVGGRVQNLGIEDVNITGSNESRYLGGLCGRNWEGTIENCYVAGSVAGGDDSDYLGGLCGHNDYGRISNCYATGSVTGGDYSWLLGGLCGINSGTISNCYATGPVTGLDLLGGLCGGNSGTISNCCATGSVNGKSSLGGLCGYNSGTVSNCYATGIVDGNDFVGGLIGYDYQDWGTYTKSFWDMDINPDVNGIGNTTDPNVIGKTTTNMKKESTFTDAGWDFIEIWNIGENQTYPYLRIYPAGDLNHDGMVDFFDFAIVADHWLEGKDYD